MMYFESYQIFRLAGQNLAKVALDGRLRAAEEELAKTSGMNPVRVLGCLRLVAPLWQGVSATSDLRSRVDAMRDLILERMRNSLGEATASGNRRKAEALVKFGADYDAAFADLGMEAGIKEVLAKTLLRTGAKKDDREQVIKDAFKSLDEDGSGKITKDEFLNLMGKLGAHFDDEDIQLLFQAADANSDGHVDYDEFVSWLFGDER